MANLGSAHAAFPGWASGVLSHQLVTWAASAVRAELQSWCTWKVSRSLYATHTPHARRPLVAVALPTTGAPSTGSRVWDQKLGYKFALSRQLLASLHLHAIVLFRVCVLAVVDLPSAFSLPPFWINSQFLSPWKLSCCIRRSSYPKCIGLIWISPALRLLS